MYKPFENEEEQEKAAFRLLDGYLALYAKKRGCEENACQEGKNDFSSDISGLKELRDDFFARHDRCDASQMTRMDFFMSRCRMDALKFLAFLLAYAMERDICYGEYYAKLQGGVKAGPTLGLAVSLAGLTQDASKASIASLMNKNSPFRTLFSPVPSPGGISSQMNEILLLKPRTVNFLYGGAFPTEGIGSYSDQVDCVGEEICIYQKEFDQLKAAYQDMFSKDRLRGMIMLTGPAHSGKHFLMKCLGAALGRKVLVVHLDKLYAQGKAAELAGDIMLERILAAELFVFDGIDELYQNGELPAPALSIIRDIVGMEGYFFFLASEKLPSDVLARIPCVEVSLHRPTPSEKAMLWAFFGKEMSFAEDVDFHTFGSQYVFRPAEIPGVLSTASLLASMAGETLITKDNIVEAVRQHDRLTLSGMVSRIPCVFTWEDLVVREETKRRLMNICDQVKYRAVVADEWGFSRKTPYGKGLYALFYGSPGTGKTMAVQVIAKELGLELFRIDLSSMVSKYIGETEKNITMLFDRAKEVNALLFFDEADALFAKRSDGNDANDRSANAQTAHLLQKMEEYEGIAILATNLKSNIDEAFSRRIKFMVHFDKPDLEIRKTLWKKVFPKEAPLAQDVALDKLAEEELSCSAIKDVASLAAHLAAADQSEISRRHLAEALRINAEKEGRIFNSCYI